MIDDLATGTISGDEFGNSVAVSGDTILVGTYLSEPPFTSSSTNSGSVVVFTRSGSSLTFQTVLDASDSGTDDWFGWSVAISGDTAVVGANRNDNTHGIDAGAAYVFVRTGTAWTQQAKLMASDGAAGDYFGNAVGVNGNTVVVGAPRDANAGGSRAGSVYVFTRSGTTWAQQTKLLASDGAANDYFGEHVAISTVGIRGVIAVGAETNDNAHGTDAGAAYLYTLNTLVPNSSWTEADKVTASDGAPADYFGSAVSLSGGTLVVGAFGDDNGGGSGAGAAYVFTANLTAGTWTQQVKLTASDGAVGDEFGGDASISGDTIVVGSSADDNTGGSDAGAAYVYRRLDGVWTQLDKIEALNGAAGSFFGNAVAVSGDTIVVGAKHEDSQFVGSDAGNAYVFDAEQHSIDEQPASVTVCRTAPVSFHTLASGGGAVFVQWQYMGGPTNVTAWTNVASGANSNAGQYLFNGSGPMSFTLTVNRSSPPSGTPGWVPASTPFQFRTRITTQCVSLTSTPATLTVCFADFNCSGAVSVQDVFDFLGAYFSTDPRADINNSGSVSVQDIFDFLSLYFSGCS